MKLSIPREPKWTLNGCSKHFFIHTRKQEAYIDHLLYGQVSVHRYFNRISHSPTKTESSLKCSCHFLQNKDVEIELTKKLAYFPFCKKSRMFSKEKESEYVKALSSLGSTTENNTVENILQWGTGSPRLPLLPLTVMYVQEMKIDFNPWLDCNTAYSKSRTPDNLMLHSAIIPPVSFQSALFAL